MAKVKCVHCHELVFEMAPECPHCGRPVANKDAPVNVPPMSRKWDKKHMKKTSPVVIFLSIVAFLLMVAAVVYITFFHSNRSASQTGYYHPALSTNTVNFSPTSDKKCCP
jgi:uncharacterized membrane protein YvbJ